MDPEAIGSTSDALEAIGEASSGAQNDVASETEAATRDAEAATPEADPEQPAIEATTPETEAETPATDDGVLVAGTSESALQPNAAARFLRSFGWSASPAEGSGGDTGQPR
jgi:hypothetical protein